MRACWLKWVGRDWSISADYIWLNYSGANIDRINRENRRRTRVVGTFPDGKSALMLVTARLKYIVEHEWGKRRYLDMSKLEEMDELEGKARG